MAYFENLLLDTTQENQHLIYISIFRYDWENDPDLATIASLRTNDTDNFLQHAAHTLAETFLMCSLEGVPVNCSETLAIIPTDQGTVAFVKLGITGSKIFVKLSVHKQL